MRSRLCLAVWLLALTLATPASAHDTLVIGRISDDPKAHYESMRPMVNYVVAHMGDLGIVHGRVLMARDAQQMVSYLRQGKVDWISETAGAAIGLQDRSGAEFLVRARRGGLYDYHSVFFARRDSGIDSIDDLPGRALGFEHPMSTSAYLVPAIILLDANLSLAIQSSPLERPPPNFVGYTFARSESNLVTWVQKGLVDAAVFSNQDWSDLVADDHRASEQLVRFHTSEEFPRALELVRPGLAVPIKERLRALLLDAHNQADASAALRAYQRTERFDAIDAATLARVNALRKGVRRVRSEIE